MNRFSLSGCRSSEIADIPIDRRGAYLFFRLISRYSEGAPIPANGKKSLGDPAIAIAVLDRILRHSTMINIKGTPAGSGRRLNPGRSGDLESNKHEQMGVKLNLSS